MHVCKLATSCILKWSQSLWLLVGLGTFPVKNGQYPATTRFASTVHAQVSYVSSVNSVNFFQLY